MKNVRVWLFRALVVVGAGVMLVSWFNPWWACDIEELGDEAVTICPWGLEVSQRMGAFEVLIKDAHMPEWFSPMMWTYLGLCMLALLVGMAIRGPNLGLGRFKLSLSQILVAGVGFSYIVSGVVAAVYASMRLKNFWDVPLQGRVFIDQGDPMVSWVETHFLIGYYLIYVAGFLLLVVGLLRDRITGEAKPSA